MIRLETVLLHSSTTNFNVHTPIVHIIQTNTHLLIDIAI